MAWLSERWSKQPVGPSTLPSSVDPFSFHQLNGTASQSLGVSFRPQPHTVISAAFFNSPPAGNNNALARHIHRVRAFAHWNNVTALAT